MLLPEYRDLLGRALALPALEDDPEDDVVLFLTPTGHMQRPYFRSEVRMMVQELRDLWERGTARDQEGFAQYVANISHGKVAL